MLPARLALIAAAAAAGLVIARRRRRPKGNNDSYRAQAEQMLAVQQQPLTQQQQQQQHPARALVPAAQPATSARPMQPQASSSVSYMQAYVLLLLSLLVAGCTAAALAARGQYDLAAAAALTWMLAAAAVLAPLRKLSAATGVAAAAGSSTDVREEAADATVLVTDLEPPTKVLAAFHGTWIKDAAASDSMDAAMRLVHLNPVMRQAVKLIRGVQLGIEEERFRFAVFSAISWFKLSEFFPWSGELCTNRRRDMRRGCSYGRASIGSSSGSKGPTIRLLYTWDAPYTGRATDEFSIDEQGRLRLHTAVTVGSDMASYTQVYRRKGAAAL